MQALPPREEVILDFRNCKSRDEVYRELHQKMEWEDWYGHNLDALWDILTGMPYRGNHFLILRPKHYHDIPYGHDKEFTLYVDKICSLFMEAQDEYGEITASIQYSEI